MKTILVADDDPDTRESVKPLLEKQDYRFIAASGGDECLKISQEETPDLILLDIKMPGTPVKNIIEQIENIKIAFMSVVWLSEARKQGLCKQDNVVDFIQKPFDANDLIDRVRVILNE